MMTPERKAQIAKLASSDMPGIYTELLAEITSLEEKVTSFTESGYEKGINWLWTERDFWRESNHTACRERDEALEALREAEIMLLQWGTHKYDCIVMKEMRGPRPIISNCDCGWREINQ